MNNIEKQQQADIYTSSLNEIVTKMEQNKTDMTNNQPMTYPPYTLREALVLLRRNIGLFSSAELPALTKKQLDEAPMASEGKYNVGGEVLDRDEAAPLVIMYVEVHEALKSIETRFNQHLINLSPNYYPNIPKAIVF